MSNLDTCEACGVPVMISRDLEWGATGSSPWLPHPVTGWSSSNRNPSTASSVASKN